MEAVCYYAYLASTELAEERGTYSHIKVLWDQGISAAGLTEVAGRRAWRLSGNGFF
jgi:ribonucleotide reductase alpha subunit